MTQANQRRLMELAHFTPSEQAQADTYADELRMRLNQERSVTIGRAVDVPGTVDILIHEARENGLPGLWKPLSAERNTAWEQGGRTVTHTSNQLRLPPDWTPAPAQTPVALSPS